MLVQPVGLSMMRMPSGIDCASFAPGIRRVCAVQAFRRKAEPCRRRNSLPPRIEIHARGPHKMPRHFVGSAEAAGDELHIALVGQLEE